MKCFICTEVNLNTNLGSVIAPLITHSMPHRARVIYIMEQPGIQNVVEGDVLGWEGQARGSGYPWSNSYGHKIAD